MAAQPAPLRTRRRFASLLGAVRLVRPLNVVLFAAGVGVGGLLGGGAPLPAEGVLRLALAAASAALVGAGANALNDAFDVAIDRHNRPHRPIPSGAASVATARRVWAVATLLGIVLGAGVSALHAAAAAAAAAALWAYNARLKRTVLAGNVVVAAAAALTLVYGGAAVSPGALDGALDGAVAVGAAFAALTTLARELVKDAQDAAGDAAGGAGTLAVVHGPARAVGLARAVLVATVALTPFPFLLPGYDGLFLLAVAAADAGLLRALWLLYAPGALEDDLPDPAACGRASDALKGAMAAGLAALALAPFG